MSSWENDELEERVVRETLEEAIGLFHVDERYTYWTGRFLDMSVHVSAGCGADHSLRPIDHAVRNVMQDIWNLCTLAYRLEWLRTLAVTDEPLRFLWWLSSSIDIEHYHVELRSVLDYVATIFGGIAERPSQIRDKSFESLYEWLSKDADHRAKLGEDASTLVLSASWYSDIRDIRNFIVHHGDHTMVLGDPGDGILFQVHGSGFRPRIRTSFLMWNENVVDFRLYGGLYFARLLVFLERLGELTERVLADRVPQVGWNARSNFMGLEVLRQWITMLQMRLDG